MNKNNVKFLVDFLMFIDFLILAVSGFVLWFFLPSGSGKSSIFLLFRNQWLKMHDLTSVILIVLLLIHLILNWTWIKCMFRNIFKKS
jgi:cytochrome b subunit of formate dehydrogenase